MEDMNGKILKAVAEMTVDDAICILCPMRGTLMLRSEQDLLDLGYDRTTQSFWETWALAKGIVDDAMLANGQPKDIGMVMKSVLVAAGEKLFRSMRRV